MNRFSSFKPGKGLILDPTCGPGEWWMEFLWARVVRMDLTNPDSAHVIGDATRMPFGDAVFDEIWCDPPHLIRNDVKHWTPGYARYGHWKTRAMWEGFLSGVNHEFVRVLKPDGRLLMKIIDGKDSRVIKRKDLNLLTRWDCIREETWKSGAAWSTCVSHMVEFKPLVAAARKAA